MEAILNFYHKLKIPTYITIICLIVASSICLFSPQSFLQMLGLDAIVKKYLWICGIVFLVSTSLCVVYIVFYCFKFIFWIFNILKKEIKIANKIKSLTKEDCNYIIKCYTGDEYLYLNPIGKAIAFQERWDGILDICFPKSERIRINTSYRVTTTRRIVKKVKRRLECIKNES